MHESPTIRVFFCFSDARTLCSKLKIPTIRATRSIPPSIVNVNKSMCVLYVWLVYTVLVLSNVCVNGGRPSAGVVYIYIATTILT